MDHSSESPADLIGQSLNEFSVEIRYEVYRTNDDGMKSKTIGYFKDQNIAQAFAEGQPDGKIWNQVCSVVVLVSNDNTIGFILGKSITILSDEDAALDARNRAVAKLSPAERALLKV